MVRWHASSRSGALELGPHHLAAVAERVHAPCRAHRRYQQQAAAMFRMRSRTLQFGAAVTTVDDFDAEDLLRVLQQKVTLTVRVHDRVRHELADDHERVLDDVVIAPCLAMMCDEMARAGDLIRPFRDAERSRPGTAA